MIKPKRGVEWWVVSAGGVVCSTHRSQKSAEKEARRQEKPYFIDRGMTSEQMPGLNVNIYRVALAARLPDKRRT